MARASDTASCAHRQLRDPFRALLIMQPAMGAGVAALKAPRPHVARFRSIVTHTVYGVGLYVSAWLWALLND
jgi:Protein of unknown function (DUF2938)